MKKGDDPIIVEQFFNRSIESVWKAITEVEQMRQWFFENIPEFKRESCIEGWTYFIKKRLKEFLEE